MQPLKRKTENKIHACKRSAKSRKPPVITNDVGNYEKHPFFVKKVNEAKEFLAHAGLPKQFVNKLRATVVRRQRCMRGAIMAAGLFFGYFLWANKETNIQPLKTGKNIQYINIFPPSHVNSKIQSYPYTTIHLLKTAIAKKPKHPV